MLFSIAIRFTNQSTPFHHTIPIATQTASQSSQSTMVAPLQNETSALPAPRTGGGSQHQLPLQLVPQDLPPGQLPPSAVIFAPLTAESVEHRDTDGAQLSLQPAAEREYRPGRAALALRRISQSLKGVLPAFIDLMIQSPPS